MSREVGVFFKRWEGCACAVVGFAGGTYMLRQSEESLTRSTQICEVVGKSEDRCPAPA